MVERSSDVLSQFGTMSSDGVTSRRSAAMRVAIIGVGNVGKALGSAAVAAGHSVVLTASDPAHAVAAAQAVGATAAASNAEAVRGADLVVLAVPGGAVRAVAAEIADAVGSGVVVDSTNPLNATYSDLDIQGVSRGSAGPASLGEGGQGLQHRVRVAVGGADGERRVP
jgi:ketol-acid reductoisomerase